jgi:hypothetical protein
MGGRSQGKLFHCLLKIKHDRASYLTKLHSVGATHQEHAAHVRSLIKKLSTDQDLFRKVYRHAFVGGRERDQKALSQRMPSYIGTCSSASPV